MIRSNQQGDRRGDEPPLILAVERILADEEREGGHTARSLARLVTHAVLLDLIGKGIEIPTEILSEFEQHAA